MASPRMAAEYTFGPQQQAGQGTMDPYCFNGILGTGGFISAGTGQPRGDHPLVDLYREDQKEYQEFPDPPEKEKVV